MSEQQLFLIKRRCDVVETLELTINATTREEKFRSRLNKRNVMTFKFFDTNWVFSPQDPTNVRGIFVRPPKKAVLGT